MKILIVGASGFLGKKFIKILGEKNEVYGTYHKRKVEGFFHLERANAEDVDMLVGKINPDVVIDANGMSSMDGCEVDLEGNWKSNVEGTKNIAIVCEKLRKKFVFISTDAVFDGTKSDKYKENSERRAINYYSEAKIAAEKFIESNLKDFLILRPSTLYGYNGIKEETGFANFVFSNLSDGKEINIVTDQFACPTLIDDVAIAIEKLLEKNQRGIFHIVGSECLSKYDFAMKIAEIFSFEKNKIKPSLLKEIKFEALRSKHLNLSIEKIKSLGISMRNIDEGVREMKKQMEE